MNQAEWDAHFRSLAGAKPDPDPRVKDLVRLYAATGPPRRALDLACGAGANALWLAEQGWIVTAVDRSPAATNLVQAEAARRELAVTTCTADLEAHEFKIEPGAWDLIMMCRYWQRNLLEPARLGLAPHGLLIVIALLADPVTSEPQRFRVKPGELTSEFRDKPGWSIVHERETGDTPEDFRSRRAVLEIAIQRGF